MGRQQRRLDYDGEVEDEQDEEDEGISSGGRNNSRGSSSDSSSGALSLSSLENVAPDLSDAAGSRYEFSHKWRGLELIFAPHKRTPVAYANDYLGVDRSPARKSDRWVREC